MVDEVGLVGGTKSIVDIDDGHAAGTACQHGTKGRDALEVSSIANAGGDGNDGTADKAADNAGKRALHARNGNDDGGFHQVIEMAKKAVETGNAHILDGFDPVSEREGCDLGRCRNDQFAK